MSHLKVSIAHTWHILESPGKLPSEEGMKSDGEQGKSGEWGEMTVELPLCALFTIAWCDLQSCTCKGVAVKRRRWLVQCLSTLNIPVGEILRACFLAWGATCVPVVMSDSESPSQSPVMVLNRWETLTCTDLRVVVIAMLSLMSVWAETPTLPVEICVFLHLQTYDCWCGDLTLWSKKIEKYGHVFALFWAVSWPRCHSAV